MFKCLPFCIYVHHVGAWCPYQSPWNPSSTETHALDHFSSSMTAPSAVAASAPTLGEPWVTLLLPRQSSLDTAPIYECCGNSLELLLLVTQRNRNLKKNEQTQMESWLHLFRS